MVFLFLKVGDITTERELHCLGFNKFKNGLLKSEKGDVIVNISRRGRKVKIMSISGRSCIGYAR